MKLESVQRQLTEEGDGAWIAEKVSDRLVCNLDLQDDQPFHSSEEELLGRQQVKLRMADGPVMFDKAGTEEYLGERSVVSFGCYEEPS